MSYTKQTWADAPSTSSPLSAARLTHMEEGIEAAAATADLAAPASRKVNGKSLTTDVTLTKSDVGLGVVDNTSDASKPISTAAAAALANKVAGSVNGTATGLTLWTGTAAQFAAVTPKSPTTIYTYPGGVFLGSTPLVTVGTVTAIVTVDHTKVPADLTGFPLYVNLAAMPDAWWKTVLAGGWDIRCRINGKEVPREVVFCNPPNKIGELWIKADLSSTNDTVIKISVDGVSPAYAATDPLGAQAVWSDGFVGVWHMQDAQDSTQYANHGTATATTTTPGIISSALSFDGANPSKIEIPAADSLYLTPNNQWQMSAWGKTPGQPNVVLRSAAARGYVISIPTNSSTATFNFGVPPAVDNQTITGTTNKFTANAWHQWVSGYDGTKLFLAVDGGNYETKTPTAGTTLVFQKDKTFIGANATFGGGVTGAIDEVRISNKARSQAWIATEYANQNSPATFYTVTGA